MGEKKTKISCLLLSFINEEILSNIVNLLVRIHECYSDTKFKGNFVVHRP